MSNSILVIEDSRDVRENTVELLELAGYKILSAKNGKEGLELAKKNQPDLILCDVMMPGLDGYGVLRALQNLPNMIGTPFVFLTAKAEKSDFRTGMDLGADDYLTKPFNNDDLLKVVSTRIKRGTLMKKQFNNNLEGLNDFINEAKTLQDLNTLSDNRTVKKIRKKELVFREGDSPNFLYFMVSGKVKTFKTNDGGKEYITEIYKEGDSFGFTALLNEKSHKESAMAIEDSEVALIPKKDFFQLLYTNNDVSLKFIKFLTNSLAQMEEKLIKLAYDSARKRVAEALLFIHKKYKTENENENTVFPVHRDNLSALAGISPESISRNLTDFREEKLIETQEDGKIKIIDLKKLEMLKN